MKEKDFFCSELDDGPYRSEAVSGLGTEPGSPPSIVP